MVSFWISQYRCRNSVDVTFTLCNLRIDYEEFDSIRIKLNYPYPSESGIAIPMLWSIKYHVSLRMIRDKCRRKSFFFSFLFFIIYFTVKDSISFFRGMARLGSGGPASTSGFSWQLFEDLVTMPCGKTLSYIPSIYPICNSWYDERKIFYPNPGLREPKSR